MKRITAFILCVLLTVCLLGGCSENTKDENKSTKAQSSQSSMAKAGADVPDGRQISAVKIDFDFERMSSAASNQFAVWIEDESGKVIKTLSATDFTAANRGYEKRSDALSNWVKSANAKAMSDDEIDSISGATPASGKQEFSWNLDDENEKPVPDGKYYIKIEGTLYWDSNVLYTGEINLGNSSKGEVSVSEKRSKPEDSTNETMINNVKITAV